MKYNSILVREDGKRFKVIEINHWTLVLSCGMADSEEDRVKHIADKDYVGFYSKKKYTLTNEVFGV